MRNTPPPTLFYSVFSSIFSFSPGENLVSKQTLQIQEAYETRQQHHWRQRVGQWPRTVKRLSLSGTCVELPDHREDFGGVDRVLHPQLHLMVPNRTSRVYATVTADVKKDLSPRLCRGRCINAVGPLAGAQHRWDTTATTPEICRRQLTQRLHIGRQKPRKRLKETAMRPRATCPWHSAEAVDKWILYWLLFISILSSFCFRFNVIAFFFLFLPHHPFVMRRPVWRWPEISPRLFTVQREEKVCVCVYWGEGESKPNIGLTDSIIRLLEPQRALCEASTRFVVYM